MQAPAPDLIPLDEERAVITRLHAGDRSAAATLVGWYSDKLYRQIIWPRLPVREQAEDVLRDTFRLALERIHQFTSTDRSIYFWLRRIAVNRIIDHHRAQQRAQGFYSAAAPGEAAERTMSTPPPAPDRLPELEDTRAQVELSLSRLNPRYALALRLRLLEDREREECAAILGVTVGNFDVILHRACKAFRGGWPPDPKAP